MHPNTTKHIFISTRQGGSCRAHIPVVSLLPRASAAAPFALLLLCLAFANGAQAGTITKLGTGTDLTAGASWNGSSAPGSGDVAAWASTSLGASLTLGSAASWGSLSVAGALSDIGITGAGTLTLGGLDMTSSAVNMSIGNPLALTASQTWNVNLGKTLTSSGVISGSGMVLTKSGGGTLTLSGASTYTGGTTLSAGQLNINNQGSSTANSGIGTGPLSIAGGTVDVTAASSVTVQPTLPVYFDGDFTFNCTRSLRFRGATLFYLRNGSRTITVNNPSGNGFMLNINGVLGETPGTGYKLTKDGPGWLYMNSPNTFSGGVSLKAGHLSIGAFVGALGTGTFSIDGPSTIGCVGTLTLSTIPQAWNADFGVSKFAGDFASDGNTVNLGLGAVTLGGNRQVSVDTGLTLIVGGVIGDGGHNYTLTKAGPGTLSLGGANTYGGTTTLSGGTLQLNSTETAGTSGPLGKSAGANPGSIVLSGGTLQYSSANQNDYSGRFSTAASQAYNIDVNGQTVTFGTALTSSGGALTLSSTAGGGGLALSGLNTYTGTTTISAGTLTLSGIGWLGGGFYAANIANNGTFTHNSLFPQTLSGVISGTGALTQSAGTLTLSGLNTYTGTTTLSGGLLQLNSAETAGTSGPVGKSAAANPGSIVLSGGTLQYSSANQNDYSGRFSTAASQAYIIDVNGQTVTFGTALTSSGGALTLISTAGGGRLTLNGANTYTGATIITAGTLALGIGGSLAGAPQISIANGATFDVSASGFTFTGSSPQQTLAGSSVLGIATINAPSRTVTMNPSALLSFQGLGDVSSVVGKISVTGNLTLNANAVTINITNAPLRNGTYRLMDCSGVLANTGTFGAPTVTGVALPSRATAAISVTTGSAGHLDLVISGGTAGGVAASPGSTSVCVGSAASFAVTGSGSTPLSYAWRKRGSGWAPATQPNWTFLPATGSTFIGSSSEIDTSGQAWGLYGNTGTISNEVYRTLPAVVLSPGQTLSWDMENTSVNSGGKVAITLEDSGGPKTFELGYAAGAANYYILDGAHLSGSPLDTGLSVTTKGLHVDFTMITATTYSVTIKRLEDGASVTITGGTYLNHIVRKLHFWSSNAGTGNNFYFNNLFVAGSDDNAGNYSTTWSASNNFGQKALTNGVTGNGSTISGAATASLQIASTAAADAGNYDCVVYNSDGYAASAAAALTVGAPAMPGAITQGNPTGSSVCSGASGVTYMISAVSGATTYTWTLPAGASITAGAGTTSITVNWGTATSGSVMVTAGNACGTSAAASLAVTVSSPPTTATVGGAQNLCGTSTVTTAGLGGNTPTVGSGAWSVVNKPDGANVSFSDSTAGNSTATVDTCGAYTLRWTISNGTCTPSAADVTVTFHQTPPAPTTGSDSPICVGSTLHLTASQVDGATYAWTGPNGFTSSAQNPTIDNVGAAASGQYSVTATVNGCGSTAGITIVTVNASPSAPNAAYTRAPGTSLKIRISDLTSDTVQSVGAGSQSASITQDGTYIKYLPEAGNDNADSFTYTTANANCTRTGTLTVTVIRQGGLAQEIQYGAGGVAITFAGIPGIAYDVQRSASPGFAAYDTLLTTNAPAAGVFSVTDTSPLNSSGFYRLMQH